MSADWQAQGSGDWRQCCPATATAAMDIRLVQGVTVESQMQRVVEHIRKQGYFVVDREPDAGTRLPIRRSRWCAGKVVTPNRTPMDLAISREVSPPSRKLAAQS